MILYMIDLALSESHLSILQLEVMNVDGSQRRTLIEHVQHGRGIAIFQNYLYYAGKI